MAVTVNPPPVAATGRMRGALRSRTLDLHRKHRDFHRDCYNIRMLHKILICVLAMSGTALAQVPAGPPYDAEVHPNPVVTFVTDNDFHPTTFANAIEESGVELLGLSSDAGSRESIEITDSGVIVMEILRRKVEALVYPVVRQRFQLTGGGTLTLYSFRPPTTDIPEAIVEAALNEYAFRSNEDPRTSRFGSSALPEQLEVWGAAALLFENNQVLTLLWQDRSTSYVVDSEIERTRLLRLIDDLL
jgi:hypothetical protein